MQKVVHRFQSPESIAAVDAALASANKTNRLVGLAFHALVLRIDAKNLSADQLTAVVNAIPANETLQTPQQINALIATVVNSAPAE